MTTTAAAVVAACMGTGAAHPVGSSLLTLAMVPPVLPPMPNREEGRTEGGLLDMIFPGFNANTFLWRISLLQLAEYAGSCMLGSSGGSPKLCSLYLLGASWGPAIASGAFWRLFFPIMLHANTLHIFFNLFFQLRIGFGMEKQFGHRKFCLLYIFCGFLGNLLSVMVDPMKLAVGASTSGFGLLGVWAAEVFLTWHLLGSSRMRIFMWFSFMVMSCVMMSTLSPNVDFVGHFAGALAGFLMAIILADMQEEHRPACYGKVKSIAKNATIALVFGGLMKIMAFGPDGPIPYCGSVFNPRLLPF